MTLSGLSFRAVSLVLAATRAVASPSVYQAFCERVAGEALREMGIGTSEDFEKNGELAFVGSLPAGSCVIDVGAHAGEFARAVQKSVPGSAVHCFEPAPAPFEKLRLISGIVANNVALGDKAGVVEMHSDRPGSKLASLYKRRLDHFGIQFTHRYSVTVDTLDAYCARTGLESIELLKLDAEGHELSVLRGAHDLLSRGAVRKILFEFGGTDIDSRTFLQDFFYLLSEHGFTLHRLLRHGMLHAIPEYRELYEQFVYTNYVALRKS